MKKFILLGHKKRQGKDTFAKMLQQELGDAEIMSFADPMREILAELMNIHVDVLKKIYTDDDEIRDVMKRLGNGKMIELFGEHVWRDLLIKRAEASDAEWIIVPDFRFKREFIEGSDTINVVRDSGDGDEHQSEAELDTWMYNVTIDNKCCMANLREDSKTVVELLKMVHARKESTLLKDEEHQANIDKLNKNEPSEMKFDATHFNILMSDGSTLMTPKCKITFS